MARRKKKKLADGESQVPGAEAGKSVGSGDATTSLGDLIKGAAKRAKLKQPAHKKVGAKPVSGGGKTAKQVKKGAPTMPAQKPVAREVAAREVAAREVPEVEPPPLDARAMRLLNDAYGGATPLAESRGKRGRRAATRGHSLPLGPNVSNQGPDDETARARLGALVGGGVRFAAVDYGDGPVAAVRDGVAQRVLKTLRSPNFAAEAVLDLHGETVAAVEAAVNRFVREHRHCRHLLVVHGKGLHSRDGRGVLGEAVYGALTTGGAAPLVRALAHAHQQQGGDGATAIELM